MNFTHLFMGIVAAAWVAWVEYRLYLNLRIHEETQKRAERRAAAGLRAVEK